MEEDFIIRKANLGDVDFIVDTIIEAEKSGTDKCGFANFFGLTIEEAKKYLKDILEEEIDGCEYSLDSYNVIEINGKPIAALGGWIEGNNSNNQPSSILKANLIGYYLPKENMELASSRSDIIKGIQIERTEGTQQLEFSYCLKGYRGRGYISELLQYAIDNTKSNRIEAQLFENNKVGVLTLQNLGFKIEKEFISENADTDKYFPSNKKYLLTYIK